MDRIVVGVDESSGSQQAVEWALDEAGRREATVRLVHAVPPYESHYPYAMADVEGIHRALDEARQGARQTLDSALQKAGGTPTGVAVEKAVVVGLAAQVLVDESADAALLVVGSRGRGGFAGLLLGSVSQQAVQHSHCPVVVIPAER